MPPNFSLARLNILVVDPRNVQRAEAQYMRNAGVFSEQTSTISIFCGDGTADDLSRSVRFDIPRAKSCNSASDRIAQVKLCHKLDVIMLASIRTRPMCRRRNWNNVGTTIPPSDEPHATRPKANARCV